jgi:hypothetical protein
MADAQIVLSAVDNTKAAFESVKTNLGSLKAAAASVSGAIAAIGATAYLADMAAGVRHVINEWDELGKSAQRAGFQTAQSMSEFQYAAKLAGVDTQGFEGAVGKLAEKMADAAGGGKQAIATFHAMGLQVQDASGQLRSTEEVLTDLARAFSGWKDGPEKSALALDLFGKSGKALIPLLNGGADGLAQLRNEFRQLRGELSDDTAKAAESFNDNLSRLGVASEKLKVQLASGLLPTLVQITDKMVDAAKNGGFFKGLIEADAEILRRVTGIDLTSQTRQLDELTQKVQKLQAVVASGRAGDLERTQLDLAQQSLTAARTAVAVQQAQRAGLYDLYAGDAQSRRLTQTGRLPAAPIVPKGDAKEQESAYAAANKTISERIALQQQELTAGRDLTEIEKLESKILEDLRLSKVKVTGAERKDIEAKIEQAKQGELALKVRKSELEQATEIAKERQRLVKEGYDEAKKAEQAENDRSHAAAQTLKDIEFETSLLVMNNQQREVAVAMRDLERQGITQGTKAWETYAAAIQEAVGKRAALQENIDFFKSTWESVDRTAHDVFVNIFEGGKTAFTKLRDTLKATLLDLLYQMTIKPWVVNIVASMTGTPMAAAQTAAGLVGNGGGGLGGLGSLLNIGGSLGSLQSGGGVIGSIGSALGLTGGGGGSFASSGGAGLATDALGATVAEGTAAATLGGGLTGALAAIPGWGWALAGVAALTALFSKKKGGPKQDAVYGLLNSGIGQGQRSAEGDSAAAGYAASLQQQYDSMVRALGGTGGLQYGLGFSMDPKGTSPSFVDVTASRGGAVDFSSLNRNAGRSQEELQAAIGQMSSAALLKGLQESNIAGQIGDWLKSLGDIDTLSGGALDAALGRLTTYTTQKAALDEAEYQLTASAADKATRAREQERGAIDDALRAQYDRVQVLKDEAVRTERLNSLSTQYGQLQRSFASKDQLPAITAQQVVQKLVAAGIPATVDLIMKATKEQYLAIIEQARQLNALDAMQALIESGQDFLSLQQSLADTTANLGTAADDAATRMQDLQQSLMDLGHGISDYIRELRTGRAGTATPSTLLDNTRSNYIADLMGARNNDQDALRRIQGSAQQYIEAQKGITASGQATQAVIDQVISELAGLPAVKSYEAQSVDLLGNIVAAVTALPENITAKLQPVLVANFDKLDTNLDGGLSFAELQQALAGKATDAQLQTLMQVLDINGDGQISRLELLGGKADTTNSALFTLVQRIGTDSLLAYSASTMASAFGAIITNTGNTAQHVYNTGTAIYGAVEALRAGLGQAATAASLPTLANASAPTGTGTTASTTPVASTSGSGWSPGATTSESGGITGGLGGMSAAAVSGTIAGYLENYDSLGMVSWLRSQGISYDAARSALQQVGYTTYANVLPAYAAGTWDVPETGPAILHEGEVVLPRVMADQFRGGRLGGDASARRLEALIQQGNELLQRLLLVSAEGARGTIAATQQVAANTSANRQAAFLAATAP